MTGDSETNEPPNESSTKPETAPDSLSSQRGIMLEYGREDEEVMGLKFCNEAVMCLAQLYPPHPASQPPEGNTPLQEALLKRLGPNAYPFSMEITPLAPPSVQLVPAKEYNGAPIGTSYDVRAYIAEKLDEKIHRRTTVRMGIRVVQRAAAPPSPCLYNPSGGTHHQQNLPKQRNKNGHKTALFSCKSAPLQADRGNAESTLRRKKNLSPNTEPKRTILNSDEEQDKNIHNEELEIDVKNSLSEDEGGVINENKILSQVSFKDQFTNGIDDTGKSTSHTNEPFSMEEKNNSHKNNKTEQIESQTEQVDKETQPHPPCGGKRPSLAAFLAQVPPPHATVEKPFLLSDGKVELDASLDKGIYSHGEPVQVSIYIRNLSSKTVKRIKVFIVQHVDVCMFSNGKFKNVVASVNGKEDCPIGGGTTFTKTYKLIPTKSSTKNWIALEDSYTKTGTSLASTVTSTSDNPQDRNVFAIYVTYYVKVKLLVSVMGGELSLKLPFTLMHTCSDFDPTWTRELGSPRPGDQQKTTLEEPKPDKDGT